MRVCAAICLSLPVCLGCTTAETGAIDLYGAVASAQPPPKKVPPPVECTTDTACKEPDKPRCDVTSSSCVECLVDPDCKQASKHPRCDPASKRCVACAEGADCGGKPGCTGDGACG